MVLEKALEAEERVPDAVGQLAALDGPTGDIDQMLKEIEAGRG